MAEGQDNINWGEVERFFLFDPSFPYLQGVARKFKISPVSIYKMAHRHGWTARRRQVQEDMHREATRKLFEKGVNDRLVRFRNLRRLIDGAIDEASARPAADVLAHLLRLIQAEQEILEGLPRDQSRNRVVREHLEKTLEMSGLRPDQLELEAV